jgi:hypothetical protein
MKLLEGGCKNEGVESKERKKEEEKRKKKERNLRTRASEVSPAMAMPTCSSILNTFF